MTTHLLWLRNDLRLHDHAALAAACRGADRLLAVYCLDPRQLGSSTYGFPKTGPHRARFLLGALADLRARMRAAGGDLVVRRGRPEDILPPLARASGAVAAFVHEEPLPEEQAVCAAVERGLDAPLARLWGHTLLHRDDLPFDLDCLPDTFTAFRKRVEPDLPLRDEFPTPSHLPPLPSGVEPGSIPTLAELGLDDPPADPRAVLPFEPGETGGLARLHHYVWTGDHLHRYKQTRNGLLGADYSSKLSPWLALGCLSPRRVAREVRRYEAERGANESTYWLVFELLWRDYFRFYGTKHGARLFAAGGPRRRPVRWRHDEDALRRWCEGTTGVPFVDANMRELNATGFMSNRGRQNVASFLSRTLGIDWRLGAAYFEYRLVDYDVTSNWGNWAYVAGVGADPRDRTFDVLRQACTYDPEAAYVTTWCPELAGLPPEVAHAPWTASRPPVGYPPPVLPPARLGARANR